MGRFDLPFFTLILIIYCVTICGNLLIIVVVCCSNILHTPMYFFLTQLSIADIMLSTDLTPNMLNTVIHGKISMPFAGCITQLHVGTSVEAAECLLLMVMSYDHYLAICTPLHYMSIMNQSLCNKLVLASWLVGSCATLALTLSICKLQFCGPNTIDHFFCDLSPLLELSCSDTFIAKMVDILLGFPVIVIPFLFIIISYMFIVSAILKISSFSGRVKSFSTCSSHLAVVSMLYGTLIVMYVIPSEGSLITDKILALLYTVMAPFLNPLIYSLRNKEIKNTLIVLLAGNQLTGYKREYDQLIDSVLIEGIITQRLHGFLSVPFPVVPTFYMLPKIHKNPRCPPGRPIVAGIGSLTEKACIFIDKQLQPFVTTVESYTRDSMDLLNRLNQLVVPAGVFLVTLDVEALYTNITHELAIFYFWLFSGHGYTTYGFLPKFHLAVIKVCNGT
ncbi:olfactory receptor 1468-like [Gastrophryne carolinensis]